MWAGYKTDFQGILRYANSPEKWVRVGSLLALGLAAHGTQTDAPFDYLINMLGGQINPYYDEMAFGDDGAVMEARTTAKSLPPYY